MEIDVTHLANDPDLRCYSGSIAELGNNAAKFIWESACEQGEEKPLLTTEEEFQALRDHMAEYGAWDEDEIASWTPEECNGLAVQEAAAALREREHFDTDEEWMEAVEAGRCSGRVYLGGGGRWYLYLGC